MIYCTWSTAFTKDGNEDLEVSAGDGKPALLLSSHPQAIANGQPVLEADTNRHKVVASGSLDIAE